MGRGVRAETGYRPCGRTDVDGRTAAVLAEQRRGAQPSEHAGGLGLVDGRECHLHIAQHLRGRAAHADQDGRTEPRIPAGADDQLDATAEVGHLLDREGRRVELGHQLAVHIEKRLARLDSDHDAACVGLVQKPERLQHVRRPKVIGGACEFLGSADFAGRDEMDSRAGERISGRSVVGRGYRFGGRRQRQQRRRSSWQRHGGQCRGGVLDGGEDRHPAIRQDPAGRGVREDRLHCGRLVADVRGDLLRRGALRRAEAGEAVLAAGVAAEVASHQDRVDLVAGLQHRVCA